MRLFALAVLLLAPALPASAQREFIEDGAEDAPKASTDDVDLDAPDVKPSGKPKPPVVDPPRDPKKDPKADPKIDPKADPKKDPKTPTKDPKTPPKDPKQPEEPKPETDLDGGFDVTTTSRAAFLEKLRPRALAVKKGEQARARKLLPEVGAAALDFGIPGVTNSFGARSLGLALAREASAAAEDGRADDVTELADAARRAAPDDPATLIELAHAKFNSGGVIDAVTMAGEILPALRADPASAGSFVARSAAVVFAVIFGLLLLLAVVVAVPALRLLAFDVWAFLPRGSHPLQGAALVLLAAVAPVLAGAGAVFCCLWVMTLAMLYLTPHARAAAIVVGVFCAGLPALSEVFARGVTAPGSRTTRAALAINDVDGDAEVQRLRGLETAKVTLSLYERAALAYADRREGRVAEAVARWKQLAQENPTLGWVHGGYGTALANAGQDELAIAELGLAIERSQTSEASAVRVTAAFNQSLLHHKANHADKAQAIIGPAMQSNAAIVGELRRATFRAPDERVSHNRAFVDILPPRRELVRAALMPESPAELDDSADVVAAVARPLWHGLDLMPATGFILGFVLLWGVLAGLAARVPVACACVRCGSPASRRVDGPAVPPKTCAACFHVFLSTKSRVEATVKMKKERAIFLRGRRRGRLVTLLALWPGAGHLFAGAVATGAVLAAVFGFCVAAAVLVADGLVPGIRATSPWSDAASVAPFVVVGVLVFIFGFRSALGVADDERAGGRL